MHTTIRICYICRRAFPLKALRIVCNLRAAKVSCRVLLLQSVYWKHLSVTLTLVGDDCTRMFTFTMFTNPAFELPYTCTLIDWLIHHCCDGNDFDDLQPAVNYIPCPKTGPIFTMLSLLVRVLFLTMLLHVFWHIQRTRTNCVTATSDWRTQIDCALDEMSIMAVCWRLTPTMTRFSGHSIYQVITVYNR